MPPRTSPRIIDPPEVVRLRAEQHQIQAAGLACPCASCDPSGEYGRCTVRGCSGVEMGADLHARRVREARGILRTRFGEASQEHPADPDLKPPLGPDSSAHPDPWSNDPLLAWGAAPAELPRSGGFQFAWPRVRPAHAETLAAAVEWLEAFRDADASEGEVDYPPDLPRPMRATLGELRVSWTSPDYLLAMRLLSAEAARRHALAELRQHPID